MASHLVTSAVIRNIATSRSCTLEGVIDSGSPFNLISQAKVKEIREGPSQIKNRAE